MQDSTIVLNILDGLIGRRVLHQVLWREDISGVRPSVQEIKAILESNLVNTENESPLKRPLNKLIRECNSVLDVSRRDVDWRKTELTLRSMRSIFYTEIAEMIAASGITITKETEYFLNEIRS